MTTGGKSGVPLLHSIKLKVTVTLVLMALLPMLLAAYYTLRGSIASVEHTEQQNLQQYAANVAGRLEQFITDTRRIVIFLSEQDPVVRLAVTGGSAREPPVARLLQTLMAAHGDIELINILGADGSVLASSSDTFLGRDYNFRDYVQAALRGETYVSNIIVGNVTLKAGLFFSHPLTRDGRIVGVAVMKLRADTLWRILEEASGSAHEAMLVDGDGVLLYHQDRALLYSSLVPVSAPALAAIRATRRFMRDEITSLGVPDLGKAVIGKRSPGNVRYIWPTTGKAMIAGYAPVSVQNWVVAVSQPVEVFSDPLERLFTDTAFGVLLVAVLSLGVAALLARGISGPLLALTGQVRTLHGQSFSPAAGQELERLAARSKDEVGRLAAEFLLMQEQLQQYLRHLEETTAAKERIESELSIARAIQMGILPKIFPPFPDCEEIHCAIFATLVPAKEVGGDLYDFLRLSDGRIYFVVGDVSGKGVAASLFMAITKTLLKATASAAPTPEAVLRWVNDELARDNDAAMFVTLFCGFLDPDSGELAFANAGHNPPLILTGDGDVHRLECNGGMAMGVVEEAPVAVGCTTLRPGDAILLYTDGVTEATDMSNRLYSEQHLLTVARQLADRPIEQLIQGLMESVQHFAGDAPQADDITLMMVKRLAAEEDPGRHPDGAEDRSVST